MKGDISYENNKKEAFNELKKVLENNYNHINHWKILNISIDCSCEWYYYEAIVLSKDTNCIYWARKDKFDNSISMDLMTISNYYSSIKLD